MRVSLAFAAALLVTGCVGFRPPEFEVRNESDRDARGLIEMWLDPGHQNRTDQETGRWEFAVAAGATQPLGRLPREPAEYHYMIVRTEDGREGGGRPLNHAHVGILVVRVTDSAILVEGQTVR